MTITTQVLQEAVSANQAGADGRCTFCRRPGVPYVYRGIRFDGLCAFKGERLCPACRDEYSKSEGVTITISCKTCNRSRTVNTADMDPDAVTPRAWAYRCCDV